MAVRFESLKRCNFLPLRSDGGGGFTRTSRLEEILQEAITPPPSLPPCRVKRARVLGMLGDWGVLGPATLLPGARAQERPQTHNFTSGKSGHTGTAIAILDIV